MNLDGILFFVARAARFSLIVGAIYAAARTMFLFIRRRNIDRKREMVNLLFVMYLSALAEIIALRGGAGNTRELRLFPLRTTIGTFREGLWPFVYNFVGNLIWFVPLGMFLHRKSSRNVLLIGAAVSLSLETLQWLMQTGVTDIDDVIINALGALAGAALIRGWNKFRKSGSGCHN